MTSKREITYSDWVNRDDGVEELFSVEDESWDELETLDGALERVANYESVTPPLRLEIYHRMPVDDAFLAHVLECMMETWCETWAEEYGEPGKQPYEHQHGGDEEELLELLQRWAPRGNPWVCQPTGEVLVLSAADLHQLYVEEVEAL